MATAVALELASSTVCMAPLTRIRSGASASGLPGIDISSRRHAPAIV
jgi:hypothetical protein